ncbi:hypothetical protein [Candidatus Wolbachia massiliensis]|uniref:Uncharacterized protein n=1 Tax=Candidatus Wolbachia massiliensis TaxID=1845000 RepID=A0A7L7YKT6_9RICK|nr:hypothetical protein [Candidatus Wolbachia massiliensis]QOD37860.1 hypothetical protein ID128_03250 [Candidatus Wolbachia massiliensis]
MPGLSENLKHLYKNFIKYAKYGVVPAKYGENNDLVPENSFYKSVYYIDSVLGPIKDMIVGVNYDSNIPTMCLGRRKKRVDGKEYNLDYANVTNLLLVLYTGFAYLTYLPRKLLSHFEGPDSPKSFVEYANNLQGNAERHGEPVAKFLSLALSCIISAVVWTAALVITPLTWAVDKVSSKLSGARTEEANRLERNAAHV